MNKEFKICSALGMLLLATACQSEVKSTAAGVKPAASPGEVRATDAKNGYGEKDLGVVVAVERTFKVDIADCEKAFQLQQSESDNGEVVYGRAQCEVAFLPSDPSERKSGTIEPGQNETNHAYDDGWIVNMFATENGYEISTSYAVSKDTTVNFDTFRAAFESAMKEYAPNGQVRVVVHTVRK
jgi:hypothetical protein